MTIIILKIIGFLVFAKLFLFWVWLWQLKEYHIGRFRAHFETQAAIKIISSLWRRRIPVFTKKTTIVVFLGLLLALLVSIFFNLFAIWILVIFAPVFSSLWVLLLQVPTVVLRGRILAAARTKRGQFKDLLVIGITGSYGKTSTKEFLYSILSSKWGDKVLKTRAHQNSEVGISHCILMDLKPSHKIFIVEMGAYNRGGIKLLCGIAKPKIGILTGINEQHMSTFGSQENIIKGKYELIESLPQDGMAFFNAKNKYCENLYDQTQMADKFLYGQKAAFFGEENILGAMAVADKLGMTPGEIQMAVDKIGNRMPGVNLREGINGLKIIDSTYSANPDGVIANIEYMRNNFNHDKKIIVLPCLIELGEASKEVHKRIGRKIAEVCDLAIVTTKDRFNEIKAGAAEADILAEQAAEILLIENPDKIFEKIKSFANPPGDGETVVLLESRVPRRLVSLLEI